VGGVVGGGGAGLLRDGVRPMRAAWAARSARAARSASAAAREAARAAEQEWQTERLLAYLNGEAQ
jgi:hypothetical protein